MVTIDLRGPQGNAFALMAQAERWARQLSMDPAPIIEEMQAGDYENLLAVFEKYFPVATLVGKPGDVDEDEEY